MGGLPSVCVRAVPLAQSEGEPFVAAVAENAYDGSYPLARPLFLSVNYRPGSDLDPLRREFIRYVFSKQGQENVIKDGYFPVTAAVALSQLDSVGIKMTVAASR